MRYDFLIRTILIRTILIRTIRTIELRFNVACNQGYVHTAPLSFLSAFVDECAARSHCSGLK